MGKLSCVLLPLVLLSLCSLAPTSSAPVRGSGQSPVRVIHAAAGQLSTDVKILIGSSYASLNLTFPDVTAYIPAPSGPQVAALVSSADESVITKQSFTFSTNAYYTVGITAPASADAPAVTLTLFADDNAPLDDKAKIRFVHLIEQFPAVDVKVGNKVSVSALTYLHASDYLRLDETQYLFWVTPSGSSNPILYDPLFVSAGTVYTIWLLGTSDQPMLVLTQDFPPDRP